MRMSRLVALFLPLLAEIQAVMCSYSEDQCTWRGSGLSQQHDSVEQVWLRCAEGSVDWLYPAGALRLTLSPRLPWGLLGAGGAGSAVLSVCVKPSEQFGGAQLYLERDGVLQLLLGDDAENSIAPKVHCFSTTPGERPALFLQATPHQDISRRVAAFRYELRGDWPPRLSISSDALGSEGACRPCNNTEILMAVCTSDFVVRGNIRAVESDPALSASVIKVAATRVFRQKSDLFSGGGRLTRFGEFRTPVQCGVRPGAGSFLFTGHAHFGQAWLGCAPRYKDFQRAYTLAKQNQEMPCELDAV